MDINNQIKSIHSEQIELAREQGQADGGVNIPHQEDIAVSPFEKQTKSKYQQVIAKIASAREKALTEVSYEKIESLKEKRRNITPETIQSELDKLENDQKEFLDREKEKLIENTIQINQDPAFKSAEAKKRLYDKEYKKECRIEGRTQTNKLLKSNAVYISLLVFIGVAELFINMKAFLSFRENLIATFIMALSFGIVPVIAHFVGGMIKQWGHNKKRASYTLIPLFGSGFIVAVFYGIALLRAEELEQNGDLSLWIFFLLSVILYLGGVLMAYFHVDSSESFYRAFTEKEKAQKEFEREEGKKNMKKKKLEDDYIKLVDSTKEAAEDKITAVKNSVGKITERINSIIANYNEVVSYHSKLEDQVANMYQEAIQEYRMSNLTERLTKQPIAWNEEVKGLNLSEIKFIKEEI